MLIFELITVRHIGVYQTMTPREQVQFKILRAVELNPHTTQRQLAKMLCVSNGKIHYLVAALVEKGLLKIGNFSRNDGKTGKVVYLLTPEGIKNRVCLTKEYLARKEAEYEALWSEIKALRNDDRQVSSEFAIATNQRQK
jgi:EPS-associated MarR family transcriptional regulator